MKKFVNENGNVFEYDEEKTQSIFNKNTGSVIIFKNEEILTFITESGLWDGFYFKIFPDMLNIKTWIQYMKQASKFAPAFETFVKKDNSFKSDYEIALDIRERINEGNYTINS